MNKEEFQIKINKVIKQLNPKVGCYQGICVSMINVFLLDLDSDFHFSTYVEIVGNDLKRYCKPWYVRSGCYWFGILSAQTYPKRVKMVRKFERIALKKKLYFKYP